MTRNWNDHDIERAFAEWRTADRSDAPPFDAMYVAARARAARRAAVSPWRRTAVAAALIVAVAAGWALFYSRASQSRLAKGGPLAASLTEWHSPTAFLLQDPGDLLVKTVPTFSTTFTELNALGVRATHRSHS